MADMYPAINNSPVTELASAITAAATSITVLNGNALMPAPNLATLGRGDNAEVIEYTAKLGNTISGITRGFYNTTPQAWTAATPIARYYTAGEHNAIIDNINAKLDTAYLKSNVKYDVPLGLQGVRYIKLGEVTNASAVGEGRSHINILVNGIGGFAVNYNATALVTLSTRGDTNLRVLFLDDRMNSSLGVGVFGYVINSTSGKTELWYRANSYSYSISVNVLSVDNATIISDFTPITTAPVGIVYQGTPDILARRDGTVQTNLNTPLWNGWRRYMSVFELGLNNSATIPDIASAMAVNSIATITVGAVNNVALGLTTNDYGRITIERAERIVVRFDSMIAGRSNREGVYHNDGWLGWRTASLLYASLAELGLTDTSTWVNIFNALPVRGELTFVTGANTVLFPAFSVTAKVTKPDNTRIVIKGSRYTDTTYGHHVWEGHYHATVGLVLEEVVLQSYVDSRTRYGVTTGTATALVLTLSPAPALLYTGLEVKLKLHLATPTGTNPTLNVNGLGAKPLYKADGSSRFAGVSGRIYSFIYDGTNFILSNGGGGQLNVFTGSTAPTTFEGVWIQTTTPISSVRNDLDIWLANAWSLASYADVPAALRDVVAVEYGGYIYVIGGQNTGSNTVATLYRYNPTNNTWTTLTSMPAVRKLHSAVVVNGKIYVMGGTATGGIGSPTSVQTTYCYDIATDIWTTLANMPLARHSHAAVAVGTKIYVVGGYYSQGSATVNTCYEYDTNNDTWTTLANMPNSLFNHAAVAVGTKVYVFAGQSTTASNATYCYDTVANSWTTLAVVPYSTTGARAIAVGTKVYFGGGSNAGNPPTSTNSNAFYVYDTVANTWSALTSMSANRSMFAMVYANGFIYFMGGLVTSTTVSASVIAYALTSATYPVGTFILYRINQAYGAWQTELVTPDTPLLGVNTRMLSHFDDLYIHDGSTLRGDLPSYYGNGSAWVKFKN